MKRLNFTVIKNILMKAILACLIVTVINNCEDIPVLPDFPYNPLDPNNPNYISPRVTILTGPDSTNAMNTDSVVINWQGNQENMEFRYRLDNHSWSDYSNIATTTYSKLDEYDHTFQIQGRYLTGDEGIISTIPFTVNAITGPALFLMPKKVEISAHSQFLLELWVDETDSIAGVSTKILFNPQRLRIDNINFLETGSESFLLNNGGQLITFSNIQNDSGFVEIDCAVVTGNPKNVLGSGKVAGLTFSHISGNQSTVSFSTDSKLRKNDNQVVNINNLISTEILVQ